MLDFRCQHIESPQPTTPKTHTTHPEDIIIHNSGRSVGWNLNNNRVKPMTVGVDITVLKSTPHHPTPLTEDYNIS